MPIADNVTLGRNTRIRYPDLVNLYGCEIGDETFVGPFVEIQAGVRVGRWCKIQSHAFLCTGVTVEDEVFIGHGVMFVNDKYPRATTEEGNLQSADDWELLPTLLRRRATIGSNATVLGGVRVGHHAQVGAGAVVTTDVPDYAIVAGVPARVLGYSHPKGDTLVATPPCNDQE